MKIMTSGVTNDRGNDHILVLYTSPGRPMKVALLITVPMSEKPTTHPGKLRPARK